MLGVARYFSIDHWWCCGGGVVDFGLDALNSHP